MSETPNEQVDYAAAAQLLVQKIVPYIAQFASVAVPVIDALAKGIIQIASEVRSDWREHLVRLDALPSKSKSAMAVAAKKGWFFGWTTSLDDLMLLIDRISNLPDHEIDQYMVDYYRTNFQDFFDRLLVNNPSRSTAISAAVKAHLEFGIDGFFLSTPVFIAQADGLLSEILGVESPLNQSGKGQSRSTKAGQHLKEKFIYDQKSLGGVLI